MNFESFIDVNAAVLQKIELPGSEISANIYINGKINFIRQFRATNGGN